MTVRDFALELRGTIEQLKAGGTAAIYCDNLIAYLTEVANTPEKDQSPAALEQMKAQLQANVEQQKMAHSASLENFKAVITAGQNAIRTMLLLNGGAAVAVLAFIGHLATTPSTATDVPRYAACVTLFALGSLAAGLVSGGTYLTQLLYGYYANPRLVMAGHVMNIAVIVVGLASFVLFGWGMFAANAAFNAP